MNEVKIQIPDNCVLIKDGNTYIVKEKGNKLQKQEPPRSWKEFCERFPLKNGEAYIDVNSEIDVSNCKCSRNVSSSKNWCTSKEEAKAFLALMQLRQLRKAWVGDWEQSKENSCAGIFYSVSHDELTVSCAKFWISIVLSFPTKIMAEDFLGCFRDLCETAKFLL